MNNNFATRWERLEALKTDLLAKVEALPVTTQHKSAPNAWSPLQIAAHVAKAEAVINGYVLGFDPVSAPKPKPFLVFLLCATLRSGITLPAPIEMEPGNPPSLSAIEADWQETRIALYAAIRRKALDAPVAVHPLIRTMTVRQVLEANESHLLYHLKRFPRIKPVYSG